MKEQLKKTLTFSNIVFLLSGITLTILLSIRPMPVIYYAMELVLCSIIWFFVVYKYHIVDNVLKNSNKAEVIFSILLSLVFVSVNYEALNYLIGRYEEENSPVAPGSYVSMILSNKELILIPIITFASISLCFIFVYLSGRLRSTVVSFFKELEPHERNFLLIGGGIFAVLIVILYNMSNVFYLPFRDGELILFDAIYTLDTGAITSRNCYVNPAAPENDVRQPLFGIFAMPFGLLAKGVSYLFPFSNSYMICICIMQIILLLISMILLSRMLEVGRTSKMFFLLITTATFPFMFFALCLEQYVFAVFWAILLIYNSYKTRTVSSILSVAATGSIMTSAVLIPPLMFLNKELKTILKRGCNMLLLFCAIFICGGMISVIHKFGESLTMIHGFMDSGDGNGITNKLQQFTHFISSCIIAPCGNVVDSESYQLCASNSYNIVGIIILGLSILFCFLFRRKYIVQISACWIGFAFVLIGLLGWGTVENGTVLYSLYFFWPFIVLLILAVDKLAPKTNHINTIVLCILFVVLLSLNIKGMLEIINFGIAYYPTL